MDLRPLHPVFVAEVSGVDLRKPLAAETIAAVHSGMDRYGVLVFHDQLMTPEQQRAMTGQLGTLELGFARVVHNRGKEPPAAPLRTGYAEVADMSNLDAQGKPVERSNRKIVNNMANQLWHSDSSFQKPSAMYSLLLAVQLPSWGGETEFADMRAAYDALDPRMKTELEGLEAEHYAMHSRTLLGDEDYPDSARSVFAPVVWPIVRRHPGSGRKLLFIGAHTRRVLGMTVAEGRVLLMDLLEHATQRQFVYRHVWKPGDLVIWDNRATLHRGRRWDMNEPRELRRTTTSALEPAGATAGRAASAHPLH
jgi:alpha-ketoglutarate-dependent 2,4-dichlorophenoxyacetate dioxygenase